MKLAFGAIRVPNGFQYSQDNVFRVFIVVHQTCDQRANACMREKALHCFLYVRNTPSVVHFFAGAGLQKRK